MRVLWHAATAAFLAMVAACAPHSTIDTGEDGGTEDGLLPFPPDGGVVTWDSWAGPFVHNYCVSCHNPEAPCYSSSCHAPGDPRTPDFEDRSAVVDNASTIRCGISVGQPPAWDCAVPPRSFPLFGGRNALPTDSQRALLASWIDAGCP